MRTIKFRAWDKKRNNMILHIREIDFALGKIKSEYDLDIVDGQNSGNHYRGFEHIELMQFTGLHDKNGVEIYELMEINKSFMVVYKFNRYILQSISNGDIFEEILENGKYEVTGEYSPVEKN